jgi:hypothetical protein
MKCMIQIAHINKLTEIRAEMPEEETEEFDDKLKQLIMDMDTKGQEYTDIKYIVLIDDLEHGCGTMKFLDGNYEEVEDPFTFQ